MRRRQQGRRPGRARPRVRVRHHLRRATGVGAARRTRHLHGPRGDRPADGAAAAGLSAGHRRRVWLRAVPLGRYGGWSDRGAERQRAAGPRGAHGPPWRSLVHLHSGSAAIQPRAGRGDRALGGRGLGHAAVGRAEDRLPALRPGRRLGAARCAAGVDARGGEARAVPRVERGRRRHTLRVGAAAERQGAGDAAAEPRAARGVHAPRGRLRRPPRVRRGRRRRRARLRWQRAAARASAVRGERREGGRVRGGAGGGARPAAVERRARRRRRAVAARERRPARPAPRVDVARLPPPRHVAPHWAVHSGGGAGVGRRARRQRAGVALGGGRSRGGRRRLEARTCGPRRRRRRRRGARAWAGLPAAAAAARRDARAARRARLPLGDARAGEGGLGGSRGGAPAGHRRRAATGGARRGGRGRARRGARAAGDDARQAGRGRRGEAAGAPPRPGHRARATAPGAPHPGHRATQPFPPH